VIADLAGLKWDEHIQLHGCKAISWLFNIIHSPSDKNIVTFSSQASSGSAEAALGW